MAAIPPSGTSGYASSIGGIGCRMYSSHHPAIISAKLITPDPPRPTPTGPMVVTAIASATISTMVLVDDCELRPRWSSPSAGDTGSPAGGSSNQAARYNTMPAPPKIVDTTNATRISTGSTP